MMSESDSEDFASADEEVEEEKKKLQKSGEAATAGHVVDRKVEEQSSKEKVEEKVSEIKLEEAASKDQPDVSETPQVEKENATVNVIQRQPCGGYSSTEEAKDARKALDSLASKTAARSGEGGGGWGFGGWGGGGWGSSLLSTARSSMNSFTSQLGDGLTVVMETVESALDVPPPEELPDWDEEKKKTEEKKETETEEEKEKEEKGEEEKEEEKEEKENEKKEKEEEVDEKEKEEGKAGDGGWWGAGWGVPASVVTSGRSLVSGGLDVLETIGKRTMEVIQETDPGLSRTRNLLRGGRAPGTSLSQTLRDARQQHEERCQREERWEEERKGHFGAQFEDCQGMAHLEALEMLSSQCESKLHSQLARLTADDLVARKRELLRIKNEFEKMEDESEDDFGEEEVPPMAEVLAEVEKALCGLQLAAVQEVLRVHEEARRRLDAAEQPPSGDSAEEEEETEKKEGEKEKEEDDGEDEEEAKRVLQAVHRAGVQLLALSSSAWVGLFHKAGELALAGALHWSTGDHDDDQAPEDDAETPTPLAEVAQRLVRCSALASQDISALGEEAAARLRKRTPAAQRRLSNQLVTSVYLETGNSRAYVRDAFLLLLPVLQLSALY